jgi:sulfite reductase alpha subunit-like flavoprotein
MFREVTVAQPMSSDNTDHSDDNTDAREFLILYATESGNAIDVAQRIRREAQRRHFQPRIASIDEYPAVSQKPSLSNKPRLIRIWSW